MVPSLQQVTTGCISPQFPAAHIPTECGQLGIAVKYLSLDFVHLEHFVVVVVGEADRRSKLCSD